MKKMTAIGFLINPYAGKGREFALKVGEIVLKKLATIADIFITGPRDMGEGVINDFNHIVVGTDATRTGRDTIETVKEIADYPIDYLVVLGGDGTFANVALGLFKKNRKIPIICIAIGTMDVGPLITVKADDVGKLDLRNIEIVEIDGLVAKVNGDTVGLGFNDVVIGNTVPATVSGVIRDVDVISKLRRANQPSTVAKVSTERTVVAIEREDGSELLIAQGLNIGQVIVAPVDERYIGKAIAGGTCLIALTELPAGVIVTDKPIVTVDIDSRRLKSLEPIVAKTASLNAGEKVKISGIRMGMAVNADGNPLKTLTPDDVIEVSIVESMVKVARLS